MTQILCSHKSASPLISECVQPEIFTFVHEKVPSRKIACQPGWQADTYSVPLVLDLSQFTRLCQSKFFWKILSVKKLTFCNSVIMSNTGSLDLFEWWGNSRVVSECRNTKQQMSRAAPKKNIKRWKVNFWWFVRHIFVSVEQSVETESSFVYSYS